MNGHGNHPIGRDFLQCTECPSPSVLPQMSATAVQVSAKYRKLHWDRIPSIRLFVIRNLLALIQRVECCDSKNPPSSIKEKRIIERQRGCGLAKSVATIVERSRVSHVLFVLGFCLRRETGQHTSIQFNVQIIQLYDRIYDEVVDGSPWPTLTHEPYPRRSLRDTIHSLSSGENLRPER